MSSHMSGRRGGPIELGCVSANYSLLITEVGDQLDLQKIIAYIRTVSVRYPYGICAVHPPYARTVSVRHLCGIRTVSAVPRRTSPHTPVRCPYGICTVSVRHLQVHPPYIRRTSETSGCTDHPPLAKCAGLGRRTHPLSRACSRACAQ